jgi:hypothetical protein
VCKTQQEIFQYRSASSGRTNSRYVLSSTPPLPEMQCLIARERLPQQFTVIFSGLEVFAAKPGNSA